MQNHGFKTLSFHRFSELRFSSKFLQEWKLKIGKTETELHRNFEKTSEDLKALKGLIRPLRAL